MSQREKNMQQYEELDGWERIPFGEQLDKWAKKYQDRTAIVDADGEMTYMELQEKSEKAAWALLEMGIKKGDRILVQLPNRISFAIALFASAYIGAIPILALPAYRQIELEGIVELAEPVAYIVAQKYLGFEYLDMAYSLKKKFPVMRHIVVDGNEGGDCLFSQLEGKEKQLPDVEAYHPAVLLLSGGTTGVPKLIPRTHTDYMYNARMSAKRCALNKDSIYLVSLPVAHNFPLCCPGLLGTLDVGGKVVMAPNTSPDEILSLIEEERVTITALVPAIVSVCLEMMEYESELDLSSLKILQVGGAMLEIGLAWRIMNEWPCKLMQVFGTAEGLLCFTRLEDSDEIIADCQGTPVSAADEIVVVDEFDREVPPGEYGELICRGPYTITGYYKAPWANKESFTSEGYYRTGDRAVRTQEGNIRIGGRIKEQINRAGEKIVPSEIEAYLCKCDGVKEAAVVGVPDKVLGNKSCAFVIPTEGKNVTLDEIMNCFKKMGVAQYKFPDQMIILNTWPLTKIKKIDKKALVDSLIMDDSGRENGSDEII